VPERALVPVVAFAESPNIAVCVQRVDCLPRIPLCLGRIAGY